MALLSSCSCLVHSGPSYTARYTDRVVRAGETGQLSQLLDGSALTDRSDVEYTLPSSSSSAAVDAYIQSQIGRRPTRAGRETRITDAYARALARLSDVKTLSGTVDLTVETAKALPERITAAVDCLSRTGRTAMVEYRGVNDEGFDTTPTTPDSQTTRKSCSATWSTSQTTSPVGRAKRAAASSTRP